MSQDRLFSRSTDSQGQKQASMMAAAMRLTDPKTGKPTDKMTRPVSGGIRNNPLSARQSLLGF